MEWDGKVPDFGQERKTVPERGMIARKWYEWSESLGSYEEWRKGVPPFVKRWIIDVGEPVCWGCGFYKMSWDLNNTEASWKKIWDNWNRLPLFRCHIVPASLSGTNKISNFALLCLKCHEAAPDVKDPTYMINWLNSREEIVREERTRIMRAAIQCLPNEDAKENSFDYFLTATGKSREKEYGDFALEFSTMHRTENRGPIIKTATILACTYEFCKRNNLHPKTWYKEEEKEAKETNETY